MTLPERVQIDGLEWEVDSHASLSESLQGECDGEDCVIRIAARLTEQMRRQVFWHEVIHALLETREIQAENILHLPEEKLDEALVRAVAPALFTFLDRNCIIEWRTDEPSPSDI